MVLEPAYDEYRLTSSFVSLLRRKDRMRWIATRAFATMVANTGSSVIGKRSSEMKDSVA